MIDNALLTTTDNPHNPFKDWPAWHTRDVELGHDTCGLLARVTKTGRVIEDDAIGFAMADIVKHDPSQKHIVVTDTTFDALISIPSET